MPASNAFSSPLSHEPRRVRADFFRGVRDAWPLAISCLPWALVFGLIARPLLSSLQTLAMSAYVFSGTAQFVALDRWQAGSALVPMLLAVFAVNARYLLQGVTLRPYLRDASFMTKAGALFFLTDMSWGISLPRLRDGSVTAGYLLGAGLITYLGWVVGSIVGYYLPIPAEQSRSLGLDFAVAAALIGMAGAQFSGWRSLVPWGATMMATVLAALVLPISVSMIVGGVAGAFAGAWHDAD